MAQRSAQRLMWTLALCAGCAADPVTPTAAPPMVVASEAASNPNNVLSAVVSATTRLADSVAVLVAIAGAPEGSSTPAVSVVGDAASVPVLGLRPDTRYVLRPVAYGGGQSVAGDPIEFTTGSLPGDLPRYTASGSDPSPGFVAFAAGRYGLVIDNEARVVWYRRFPNGPGLNFQPQPTGRYAARPPDLDPLAPWVELDPLGNVTRTIGCVHGLASRFHDLHEDADGGAWILCDDTRTMDLSAVGGNAAARVTGTVVQHLSAAGALLFEWSTFDHFQITDLAAADRGGATVNWTHANALDLDVDGNLVVSFRSLSEITKIDARSGAVMWRMGGLRNEFTFEGASSPAFLRQHGVRMTAPGEITLLDNLGEPGASRAERYAVDVERRSARQIASYGSVPPVVAQVGGSTQRLAGGRTLVAFGDGRRVEEYDAAGRVVWRLEDDAGYVFRAQRIQSLYRPGVVPPR
jgi:hypothetical protein